MRHVCGTTSLARYNMHDMRDQAVRVQLGIPADVVAKMAGVGRETLRRFEIDPLAVKDDAKRIRIASVYDHLRQTLARFPMQGTAA